MHTKKYATLIRTLGVLMACYFLGGCQQKNLFSSSFQDLNHSQKSQSTVNFLSPAVFDWQTYLAINPDLIAGGLTTESQASAHWLSNGMHECRRAVGRFDVDQYLAMYSDLQAAFGNDCQGAVSHYLTNGMSEGRLGTFLNDNFGGLINFPGGTFNGVFGNEVMTLGASSRTAGAIDSLVFNGKQFINNTDHGREFAVAYSNDAMGECNNPTEPGSADNGAGSTSSTQVQSIQVGSGSLETSVIPAYWLAPNETSPGCGPGNEHNTSVLASDQPLSKNVQIGYQGDPHIIVYNFTINNAQSVQQMQIESPTAYLTNEFTSYYQLDPSSNQLVAINMPAWNTITYGTLQYYGGEEPYPAVISTPDGQYAMGVFSEVQNGVAPSYALFDFPSSTVANDTNKWSIVFRYSALPAGALSLRSFIVVGTLLDVQQRLVTLTQTLGGANPAPAPAPAPPAPAPAPPPSVSTSGAPTSNVYRSYNPQTGEHFYSPDPNEGPNAGFTPEGIAFLVLQSPSSGTIGLYRCFNGAMHFISTDSNCEGVKTEGLYGYVYTSQVGNSTALYRFNNSSDGDHLVTTNMAEGATLSLDGILGYVPLN